MNRPGNSATGANAHVYFYYNNVLQQTDDIDSIEITNNDNLITHRSLGTVITKADVDYGNFTLEIKTSKTGSNNMRLARMVENIHKTARSSPLFDILIVIDDRDNVGQESVTYYNAVLQFKNQSASEAGQAITESITATAESRTHNDLISEKTIQE